MSISQTVDLLTMHSMGRISTSRSIHWESWAPATFFEIPSDVIEVHAFRSNYRCFICKIDSIYGSLKTLHLSSDSITLAIDLKCAGQGQLLRDTIGFARDHDFFKTVFIDHQGEFDNLRLALKEPLNVRKLELFNHKLNMGSIAYRNLLAK